ncbi:MAG TPA: Asp23/Gls24 family envelope stress response protein, partial [Pseudonocardiaceae bacterium]|nr:Asp23/Gls24 family envelope stress response protein [Pseudonocardiaceae bacterium]
VVEYGVPIGPLAQAIRRNVISAIEQMTGLEVVEVNININDLHLPDEHGTQPPEPARVQ